MVWASRMENEMEKKLDTHMEIVSIHGLCARRLGVYAQVVTKSPLTLRVGIITDSMVLDSLRSEKS